MRRLLNGRFADLTPSLCSNAHQVGADINAMATHAWMAAPLPFVSGLGPRKARALLAVRLCCCDSHQCRKLSLLSSLREATQLLWERLGEAWLGGVIKLNDSDSSSMAVKSRSMSISMID